MKIIVLAIYLVRAAFLPSLAEEKKDVLKILKKTNKTYEKIKTISGDLEFCIGSPEPETDMVVNHKVGIFQFKKVKTDTSLGWYLATEIKEKHNQLDGYKEYYAGDSVYSFSLKDSTVKKYAIDDFSDWVYGAFTDWKQRVDLYYKRLILPDSIFEKQEGAWEIGEITLGKDTVIQGQQCYVIENRKENSFPKFKAKTYKVERLAIDKKYHYPVYFYTHSQRFVSGNLNTDQKTHEILSNLQINKHIPNTVFEFKGEIKKAEQQQLITLTVGDKVPNWKLPTIVGDSLSLYEQKGKLIILEFGHMSCAPCIFAQREIKKEVLSTCDTSKYILLYINPIDPLEKLKEYAEAMKISYPMLKGNEEIAKVYGISGYPYILILDTNYKILEVFSGYSPGIGKKIRKIIENNSQK